jgi:hypothetical protein
MTANMPNTAGEFPTRGVLAGCEPWELAEAAADAAERAVAEEHERQLEVAILRARRRLEGERRRGAQRRRSRR